MREILFRGKVDGYNCEDCLDIFFAKHAEVIGNIYDDPELLEVGE